MPTVPPGVDGCPWEVPPLADDATICTGACQWQAACDDDVFDDCMIACLEELTVYGPDVACDDAATQAYNCLGSAPSCEPDPSCIPPQCLPAFQASDDCLSKYTCFVTTVGDHDCGYVEECNQLDPRVRTFTCDDGLCSCTDDTGVVATCPQADVCELVFTPGLPEYTGSYAFVRACCGWPDFAMAPTPG